MKVLIKPQPLTGSITAPTSKSEAHRLLICAALADGPTDVEINSSSEDITATLECLRALGAKCVQKKNIYHVTPVPDRELEARSQYPILDCSESGSTLRFMLPVTAVLNDRARFTGRGRLPERPIGELQTVMGEHGVSFTRDHLPFDTKGKLTSGEYKIAGDVSSQYVTGLLLALSRLRGASEIVLTSPLKSAAYVDITLLALKRFGVDVQVIKDGANVVGYKIPGLGESSDGFKSPGMIPAGADWSSAAFFLTAGALTGPLSVKGLALDSPQGDKNILEQLRDLGAEVHVSNYCEQDNSVSTITVCKVSKRGREVDIDPTPDSLPILAVAAALADGTTEFVNGARLRLKESDRIASTAAMIRSLGGEAIETPDTLIVKGRKILRGGIVNGYHDHRIVMAAAVAASCCAGEVIITDAEACAKSYPGFFKDYAALGGEVRVL